MLLWTRRDVSLHVRRQPLEAVQAAAVEVVLPLFRAMVDAAEAALLGAHAQGGWGGDTPAGQDGSGALRASRYMADLTRHLAHCRCATIAKPFVTLRTAARGAALRITLRVEDHHTLVWRSCPQRQRMEYCLFGRCCMETCAMSRHHSF